MPRNGSGSYTLPVPPFTPGTVISSSDVNSDFSDIATALTGSLAADGQTELSGQLKGGSGTSPPFTFTGDTNTGFGSPGADQVYMMAGGIQTIVATVSGATVTGSLTVSGIITPTGGFTGTISTTGATVAFPAFSAVSTDAGSAGGPYLDLIRNSATPAASDSIGGIRFFGNDSGANQTLYAYIIPQITDPTNGSEDADLYFNTIIAGVDTTILRSSGAQIQVPGSLAVTGNITAANYIAPTRQILASGTAATYTTPSNPTPKLLRITMVGGGGGGGAADTNSGATGTNSLFNGVQANPGAGGTRGNNANGFSNGGLGGSAGGGGQSIRLAGSAGGGGVEHVSGFLMGGTGAPGLYGTGAGRGTGGGTGLAASANTGAGGGGGANGQNSGNAGGGGGAGEYVEFDISNPTTSYTYTVGAGGSGGAAGGAAGGAGGSGLILVEEYY